MSAPRLNSGVPVGTDGAALFDRVDRERRELDDKIRRAYVTAMEAARDRAGARVSIHLGQGVWDYLKTLSANVVRQDIWEDIGVAVGPKLFGLPVVLEPDYQSDTIEVKATWVL